MALYANIKNPLRVNNREDLRYVNRFARQLIKRYGSTADQATIRQAFQEMGDYLLLLWASLPEALPTQEAARRIGMNPQRLHELIRAGKLHGVKIGRAQYCAKREIIAYAAAPARLAHPSGETYKALVAGYWKEREKQPGDCFAYSGQFPGAML